MKTINQTLRNSLRVCMTVSIAATVLSFSVAVLNNEFLKQLGLNKTDADSKITNSILGGYIDIYGAGNAKKIALGERKAVVLDILSYTKQHVKSEAFVTEYNALKQSNKPKPVDVQTPADMRKNYLDALKKGVADTEASLKKADPSMKKIFEDILTEAKKQLKQAEDPKNEMMANYSEQYPEMAKAAEASNKHQLETWEEKYPADHLQFVKVRLQEFLANTEDIDFSAVLTSKNGKKYFVNPAYENKGTYWKMAFRAGREVVDPARAFVQQWLKDL